MKPLLRSVASRLMPLFNTKASGIYLLLFAAAIGVATFIENDFGTSAAQKVIFQAWWFELLLALFAIAVMVNIRKFRMIQQKKWALLMFHGAIVVILIGAGVTRYASFEGMMHIREAATSNEFLSAETYLTFQAQQGEQTYEFAEPVLFASLGRNHFEESYQLGQDLVEVKLKQFIPNPTTVLVEHPNGRPVLKLVVAGANGREEYFLGEGDSKRLRGGVLQFSPANPLPSAIQLRYENEQLQIASPRPLSFMVMATQEQDTLFPSDGFQPLRLRALYSDGQQNFVFSDFHPQSRVKVVASDLKVRRESQVALNLEVAINGQAQEVFIYGQKGIKGRPGKVHAGDLHLEVAYGSKIRELPFALKLYDFQLETYPGTNSAASYASEVQLIDPREGIQRDFRIYMNHILNYDGYRFFQSSYDRDEKGTYLSVNHDFWGTWISYIGYGLLTLGMIWTFFSPRTRFHQVMKQLQKLREKRAAMTIGLLLLSSVVVQGKEISAEEVARQSVSQEHATAFSQLVVQDFKGRMKPVHTLSREVLRKVSRKESWYGLSADQILLSLFANSQNWYQVPLVKLGKHPDLFPMLGLSPGQKQASYADFFEKDGSYKLRDAVRAAHNRAQADRGTLDKELLKIDERVNILRMAFTGSLLSVVPNPSDPNNQWLSAQANHQHQHGGEGDQYYHIAQNFFQAYHSALQQGIANGSYAQADQLLRELTDFQTNQGGEIMPSAGKVQSEIFLNRSRVFHRLTGWYLLLGLASLGLMFFSVVKPKVRLNSIHVLIVALVGLGFALHTLGLGLRWYVSGRAPWSNGYESMIYIAWTTTLAGMIFTRKSLGGLAATMVLAATILFVASLSFLDPEITPLVPVLRSYWLTIHVSLEAGSYGFLMLGAIIGLINLILMTMLRPENKDRIKDMILEMSYLSELTLIAGLFMISIGTYLGGVWANESWGRYWGWDAKETWALVTILIYAFILHMRIIPKLFGLFSYNFATVFGLASVIMTYYGVNYYLSGLHSYATGDPVPIPTWVYVFVAAVAVLSTIAFVQKRKYLGKR